MPRKTNDVGPRIGLFVEGTKRLVPTERSELEELWHELTVRCSKVPKARVLVHGFTKLQLVAMGDPPEERAASMKRGDFTKIPLDVEIALAHDREPFDVLIVAFDAHPANQHLRPKADGSTTSGGPPCQFEEIAFVLHHFSVSGSLPRPFKKACSEIRKRYRKRPKLPPRGSGRPPRDACDLLYMAPEFETLLVADDAAVRKVFSLEKRPKDWPTLPPTPSQDAKDVIRALVQRFKRHGPTHLRTDYDRHPHAWAREIVRQAEAHSPLWTHPVTQRLRLLLG